MRLLQNYRSAIHAISSDLLYGVSKEKENKGKIAHELRLKELKIKSYGFR